MRIILTGGIGSGKSTIVHHLRQNIRLAPQQGYLTRPLLAGERPAGFYLDPISRDSSRPMESVESRIFAHESFPSETRFGRFGIRVDVFETLASEILAGAGPDGLLVIDELGAMEQGAGGFIGELKGAFARCPNILAVIQRRALDFWLERIQDKRLDAVVYVNPSTRDRLPSLLTGFFTASAT